MKKEMKKKINSFEKKALMWADVEGADALKDDFDKFNACYKIVEKDSYCNKDKTSALISLRRQDPEMRAVRLRIDFFQKELL